MHKKIKRNKRLKQRRDQAFSCIDDNSLKELIIAYSEKVNDNSVYYTQAFIAEKIYYLRLLNRNMDLIKRDIQSAINGNVNDCIL